MVLLFLPAIMQPAVLLYSNHRRGGWGGGRVGMSGVFAQSLWWNGCWVLNIEKRNWNLSINTIDILARYAHRYCVLFPAAEKFEWLVLVGFTSVITGSRDCLQAVQDHLFPADQRPVIYFAPDVSDRIQTSRNKSHHGKKRSRALAQLT